MDNNSKFIIDYNDEGKRIDAYLSEMLVDISRSKIQSAIKKSEILVNSKGTKPSYQLRENDVIECGNFEAELHNIPPQNVPLDIIYEDENMLVVNKPSGMLTHPTTTEKENTLVNALKYRYGENLSDINGEFRRGILHRLDRNTSGLLMVAKNNQAHEFLANQIKEKTAIRKYLAVVRGVITEDKVLNFPIGRHKTKPQKMDVIFDEKGKPSITEMRVLENFTDATLVELTLRTGRTHQIRVHMSHIGHPVYNDTLYGFGKMRIQTEEQVLEAYKLKFTKPFGNEIIELEIPMDKKLIKVLDYLKQNELKEK